MNRNELKTLSHTRLKEAKILLDNHCYDGAYYLCGYSVECALKACIARNSKRYDFPDKKIATESHTHELSKLVKLAGLEPSLIALINSDSTFQSNWAVTKDWSEITRYQRKSRQDALDLFESINQRSIGILSWIKRHW